MTKRIIKLTLATFLFYATGRLGDFYLYKWTITIIESFSSVPLSFGGKFPFFFFGDPKLGLIIASIPLTVVTTNLLSYDKKTLGRTSIIYSLYFVATYLLTCSLKSMELLVSNDFYKAGQVLTYDVRQVNLYEIFLTTIIITTFATAITLAVTKLIKTLKKKRHKPDNTWETNAST